MNCCLDIVHDRLGLPYPVSLATRHFPPLPVHWLTARTVMSHGSSRGPAESSKDQCEHYFWKMDGLLRTFDFNFNMDRQIILHIKKVLILKL